MAIDHPPHTSLTGQQQRVDWEGEGEGDEKAVVRAFLWTLFCFKLATIILIIWATRSWELGALVAASTWPFLIVPAIALAGPAAFYIRRRRVRRRRAELQRAEWMLD